MTVKEISEFMRKILLYRRRNLVLIAETVIVAEKSQFYTLAKYRI